ncbi:MAG: hypothetical protein NTV46_06525 [Verrucomicrobia bacterium]|nr:hypothetical protein [Verrucomicrobiota bacterium]
MIEIPLGGGVERALKADEKRLVARLVEGAELFEGEGFFRHGSG